MIKKIEFWSEGEGGVGHYRGVLKNSEWDKKKTWGVEKNFIGNFFLPFI